MDGVIEINMRVLQKWLTIGHILQKPIFNLIETIW